jgi:resuscitation-promoting factor RpfA
MTKNPVSRLFRPVIRLLVLVVAITGLQVVVSGAASADPSPNDWQRLRQCESGGDYSIVSANGRYYGAYQFDLATWRSVGGAGLPSQAAPAEQDYRALYLYRLRGWQPWSCARILGLVPDADAGSGVVPPPPA